MRKLLLTTFSFACFFALSTDVSAQNLVANGDFEATIDGTVEAKFKIPNWLNSYGAEFAAVNDGTAITSQTIRINGKQARYLTSDVINVTAGHTYKFTFTARVQDVAGNSGDGTAVGVLNALIMDGTANGNLDDLFTPLAVSSNYNTTLTENYTAPASGDGSSSIRIRFSKPLSTVNVMAYLDDVSIIDLGVLPIALTSFTGNSTNDGVRLKWATASESNNKDFNVFSSINGKDFTQIGTVSGAGNSTSIKNYSFNDKTPTDGVNYYKLTQTDFDGKTTSFDPIVVNFDLTNAGPLKVYATQTKVQGQISWTQNEQVSATVRDLNGETVLSHKINLQNGINTFVLDGMRTASSTIYVLTVSGSSATISTKFYIN